MQNLLRVKESADAVSCLINVENKDLELVNGLDDTHNYPGKTVTIKQPQTFFCGAFGHTLDKPQEERNV